MTNSTKDTQLDPFTFPTETDGRFLLLVLMIAGTALGLILNLLYAYTRITSKFTMMSISISIVGLIFVWAWRQTKKAAGKEIKAKGWSSFPPPAPLPSEQDSLNRMQTNVQQTVAGLPEVTTARPHFVWDGNNRTVSGKAFGYGRRQYVLLRRGLYDAFVLRFESFQAILLHELGHIANRDASKTVFSIQLGRCFFKIAIAGIILLYLYLGYFGARNLFTGRSLDSVWQGFTLIAEMTIKLLLLFLLIEIIRSSVLRVREFYADARASMWMGKKRHLIVQILAGDTVKTSTPKSGWGLIKQWFRKSLAPQHPDTKGRVSALKDSRKLFHPSLEMAVFAGILTGLTLNGNFAVIGGLVEYMLIFSNMLTNPIVQGDTSSIMLLVSSMMVDIVAVVLMAGALVVLGVFPIAATVGIQVQKAAFADKTSTTEKRLLPTSKLFLISFLLGLGIVLGFVLTPTPEALSIGALSVRGQSLVLAPFILPGWTILFFLWLIPLRGLAGRLYTSHSGTRAPTGKRKLLTIVSILGLLPATLVMSWTQIIVTSSTFFDAAVADDVKLLLVQFVLAAWGSAIFLTLCVWSIAWLPVFILGRLRPRDDKMRVPAWAALPEPITLPEPPVFQPALDAPPPL